MDPVRLLRLGRVDHRRIPIRASCSGNLVFKRFHLVSEALSGTGAPMRSEPGRLRRRRWRILFEASRGLISAAIFSNAGVE